MDFSLSEYFPDQIYIVDDDCDRASKLQSQIEDLSWVLDHEDNSMHNKVPDHLIRISKEKPNFFKEDTQKIVVNEVRDLNRKAARKLKGNKPSISFIDFYYENLDPSEIDKIYRDIDEKWKIAAEYVQKGGCICGNYFDPSSEHPIRVMVPSTEFPPSGIFDISDAIADDQSLRTGQGEGTTKARKAIIKGFRKWVDLKTPDNPLDDIWASTKDWFGSEDQAGRSHDWPHGWPGNSRSEDFIEAVETTFDLELPERWADANDLSPFYNSVKGLCGDSYCGEGGKNNLTIGSVLLIALLALRDTNADYREHANDIRPSDLLDANAKFLKKQSYDVAKHTARSLYFFFKMVFKNDPKHESTKSHPWNLTWDGGPELIELTFDLHWGASGDDSLAGTVSEQSFELHSTHPGRSPSNTTESLEWLWSGLLRSSRGFGHPGSIMIGGEGSGTSHLKITAPAK